VSTKRCSVVVRATAVNNRKVRIADIPHFPLAQIAILAHTRPMNIRACTIVAISNLLALLLLSGDRQARL